jgi:hypothetical protein
MLEAYSMHLSAGETGPTEETVLGIAPGMFKIMNSLLQPIRASFPDLSLTEDERYKAGPLPH